MISCDKGEIRIKGTKSDIKAELSCLLRALVVHGSILTKDDLNTCMKFVDLTDKEIEEETKKVVLSMIFNDFLLRSLKDAVKNNDEEEDE